MKIRVLYSYLLNIFGIRKMLPSDILRSKPVKECHEPMVHLTSCDGLFLSGDTMLCRQSVAEKLRRVAKLLFGQGLWIYIYELYRSPEQQQIRLQDLKPANVLEARDGMLYVIDGDFYRK